MIRHTEMLDGMKYEHIIFLVQLKGIFCVEENIQWVYKLYKRHALVIRGYLSRQTNELLKQTQFSCKLYI